ncbi:tetratricopeptide repeat protein [Candidatus Poribacteria bacterium]|nr:tetratricopeptide repeat protein [Candidatus Poribacteria bacterium]
MSLITDALEKLDDRAKSGKFEPGSDGGVQPAASVSVNPPKRNLKVVYLVSAILLALVAAFCLWRLVFTVERPAKAIAGRRAGAMQEQVENSAGGSVRTNSPLQQANPAMPDNITPQGDNVETPQSQALLSVPASASAGANSVALTDQKQSAGSTQGGGSAGANLFTLDGQEQHARPSPLAIRLSSTLEAKPSDAPKEDLAGAQSRHGGTPSHDRAIPSTKLSGEGESADFEKLYRQALDCQYNKDYFGALKWYKECLRTSPDAANVHANMGVIFARMQDSETAIEHLRKALSIDPENETAHNNLGVVFLQKGDYESAISEFETSLTRNPGNIEGYVNLGIARKRLGRQQAALDALEAALRIDSAHPDANFNYALLLDKQGKYAKARIHYERFLQHAAQTDARTVEQVQDRIRYLEKKPEMQR